MSEKLGQEPAYPVEQSFEHQKDYAGMNKRFYAACAAMQGMISNYQFTIVSVDDLVRKSFEFADELLKQENER